MSLFVVPCPECSYELRLPNEAYLGRKGKCPQCGHKFILENPIIVDLEPAPMTEQPAAVQESPRPSESRPDSTAAPKKPVVVATAATEASPAAMTPPKAGRVDEARSESPPANLADRAPAPFEMTAIQPPPVSPLAAIPAARRTEPEPEPVVVHDQPSMPVVGGEVRTDIESRLPAPPSEKAASTADVSDAEPSTEDDGEESSGDTVDLREEIAAEINQQVEAAPPEAVAKAMAKPAAEAPAKPVAKPAARPAAEPRPAAPATDSRTKIPALVIPSSEPPSEFGRYQVLRKLGQGAMGAVYLALDSQLDRHVALKIPTAEGFNDRSTKERFFREARAAALLRHSNICPVHDIGEIDGLLYISMAYINGRPLSEYIARSRPQAERKVATTIRRVALALAEAHEQGIVHRDLKPDNIMIDDRREPIIMDFGLARQMNREESTRLTPGDAIVGSPAYMSPEQVEGNPNDVGPASDIFSLGVVLYELLTQRRPFEGTIGSVFHQIVSAEPKRPTELRPDLDPWMEAICLKMMAKRPEDRYPSMSVVADALAAFLRLGADKGSAGLSVVLKPARDQGSSTRVAGASASVSDLHLDGPSMQSRPSLSVDRSGLLEVDLRAAIWVLNIGGILSLTVDGREIKGLNSVDDLPTGAFRVKTIGLFNNQHVTDDDLAVLSDLRRLEAVTLTKTKITDAGLEHLKKIPQLKILSLDRTKVTPKGLKALEAELPNCKISYGSPAPDEAEDGRSPDRRAAEWVLTVGGTLKVSLPKGETRTVAALENIPAEEFRVIDVSLLRRNLVDDHGLRHLKGLDALVVLRLSDTGVTDAGLVHLRGLQKLPVLDLSFTKITDKGLTELRDMRGLRQLDLANTRVTDEGLKFLTALVDLQFLGLYGTKVSDQGIKVLEGLRGLQFLGLGNTAVTDAGVKALKSKLTNCTISRQ